MQINIQKLSARFQISDTTDLVYYLGMSLVDGQKSHALSGWKMKRSSKATKLLLIQSMTSTIGYYAYENSLIACFISGVGKAQLQILLGRGGKSEQDPYSRLGQDLPGEVIGGLDLRSGLFSTRFGALSSILFL